MMYGVRCAYEDVRYVQAQMYVRVRVLLEPVHVHGPNATEARDRKSRPLFRGPDSNQPFHRHLNRHSVQDFLLKLSCADVAQSANRATYDAAYARLVGLLDPASSFERTVLDFLYQNRLRLPDHAQHPARDIAVQPDFYYERNGVPGVCVFLDGHHHSELTRSVRDRALREALKDQGFRVVGIAGSRPLAEQIAENADIFRDA